MKHAWRWMPGRRILRLFGSTALALPLFQAMGCSLFEPQNLVRIGFNAVLAPINDVVFDVFATLATGL